MKPVYIVSIVAIIAVVAIFAMALAFNAIPGIDIGNGILNSGSSSGQDDMDNAPLGTTEIYTDTDIFYAMQQLKGSSLDYATCTGYVDALHMEMYGIDDKQYTEVVADYMSEYSDWAFQGNTPVHQPGWNGAIVAWTQGLSAKSIIVGSGNTISVAYGHDTLIILANGPISIHQSFIIWITS